MLLAAGANVEAANDTGRRPLHSASSNGHAAVATLLLDAGADVNALTNHGRTPLGKAETPAMRALLAARGGV
jgi:ankyrin repeat protein